MKRLIALTLALTLLLCGCGGMQEPAQREDPAIPETAENTVEAATEAITEAATEPTTEPTTAPTEPPVVYFDPLNGEILDAPYDGRIYAVSIGNEPNAAIPHVNIQKADVVMEMFVNNSKVRFLALVSDPDDVEAIGSVRSVRLMFTDIAQHYNAIIVHGGAPYCMKNADERGLTHYNVDSRMRWAGELNQGTAYRDKDHPKIKYGEHNLYAVLPGVKALAESEGVQVDGLPETDYGFRFTDDGTPVGEDAAEINIMLVSGRSKKETGMVYHADLDKYVMHQFGMEMTELFTGDLEAYQNVIVMYHTPGNHEYYGGNGVYYQTANFLEGGTGYYANGGKIMEMYWTCESEDSPFVFHNADGSVLELGRGNTYIAVVTPDSTVTWTNPEPVPEETTTETVAETTAG